MDDDDNDDDGWANRYTLVRYGAKETALIILENEWWRLLASIMLHGGIWHIIPNVAIQVLIPIVRMSTKLSPSFYKAYPLSGATQLYIDCYFCCCAISSFLLQYSL